jgi:hypothetical protein
MRPIGGAEELGQSLSSSFGSLFGEKVTGTEGISLNLISPVLPERDRPPFLDVPSIKRSLSAPQSEEATDYSAPAHAIRFVMFAVDGRGGPILLADSMSMSWIAKRLHIGRSDLRREHSRGRTPFAEGTVDDGFRGGHENPLGKRFGLSE